MNIRADRQLPYRRRRGPARGTSVTGPHSHLPAGAARKGVVDGKDGIDGIDGVYRGWGGEGTGVLPRCQWRILGRVRDTDGPQPPCRALPLERRDLIGRAMPISRGTHWSSERLFYPPPPAPRSFLFKSRGALDRALARTLAAACDTTDAGTMH
jgi:hypothetical protein